MLRFLDLRPRAILVRSFTKDGLEQSDEMKAREAGSPSHPADGNGLVFPSAQQIPRKAESAQQLRTNHLWDNDYIGCGAKKFEAQITQ